MVSRSFERSHWSRRPSNHNKGGPAHSIRSGMIGEENPQIDQPLFLHMPGDQLGHLKHADLLLAVEHGFQRLVSIDEGLLFCILHPILADISPKPFRQLRPWKVFWTGCLSAAVCPTMAPFSTRQKCGSPSQPARDLPSKISGYARTWSTTS